MSYDSIYSRDNPRTESGGWIQWKGTDVCMDIHCRCGATCHFDGDFFYTFKCKMCGQVYAVGQNIKMIHLTKEEIENDVNEDNIQEGFYYEEEEE